MTAFNNSPKLGRGQSPNKLRLRKRAGGLWVACCALIALGALLCALTATPAAARTHPLTAADASDEAWTIALSPALILPLNVSNISVSEGYPYTYGHQRRRVDAYYTNDDTGQRVATARIVIHRTRHDDRVNWYWLAAP